MYIKMRDKDGNVMWHEGDVYTGVQAFDGKQIYSDDIVKAKVVHDLYEVCLIGKVVFLEGKWWIGSEKERAAIELWSESNVLTILEGEELEEYLNE
ncbi:hypothetical protein [Lysinibacillus phage vB_LspM-01]|nr:hypothetical protein [Lysinibacillus phage vB_LspM-01]